MHQIHNAHTILGFIAESAQTHEPLNRAMVSSAVVQLNNKQLDG